MAVASHGRCCAAGCAYCATNSCTLTSSENGTQNSTTDCRTADFRCALASGSLALTINRLDPYRKIENVIENDGVKPHAEPRRAPEFVGSFNQHNRTKYACLGGNGDLIIDDHVPCDAGLNVVFDQSVFGRDRRIELKAYNGAGSNHEIPDNARGLFSFDRTTDGRGLNRRQGDKAWGLDRKGRLEDRGYGALVRSYRSGLGVVPGDFSSSLDSGFQDIVIKAGLFCTVRENRTIRNSTTPGQDVDGAWSAFGP